MEDKRLEVPTCELPPVSEPVGAQVPTNFLAPLWHTTAGDDAVDLAAVCGIKLLPWQQLVLRNALGEDKTGRYMAQQVGLIVPRQNGKNVVLLARELAGLFLFHEETIVHTAHRFKTAREAFRDLRQAIMNAPEELRSLVRAMPDSTDRTAVIMKDDRRCEFLARPAGSGNGRGFTGDLVVMDEAYQLNPDVIDDLLPTLSSRRSPQIWFTSSTGFDDSEVLKQLREDALEHPEDNKTLAFFEWSANLRRHDWKTVEAVQEANPSLGWFQSWDWIRETELRRLSEESYKRERLGVWADAVRDAAIGADLWKLSRGSSEMLIGNRIVARSLALEVTKDRDRAFIAGASRLADGRIIVEIIAERDGVAWVPDVLRDLCRKHRPVAGVVIDAMSGAASLNAALTHLHVPVSLATTRDLTEGTAAFYDSLAKKTEVGDPDPTIFHGDNPSLDDAAHTARRRLVGSSKTVWTWEQQGTVTVAPLRAVTLAVRGFDMPPVMAKRARRAVV